MKLKYHTVLMIYYVHDPMCSWCWGIDPTLRKLLGKLPDNLPVIRLLGGLAPDSDEPMSKEMRRYVQNTWKKIQQQIPGTQFNFAYWDHCKPRRSTYIACRSVIAARLQGDEYDERMTQAIQRAYYLEAKNPSDSNTLIGLAEEIGLDKAEFSKQLNSEYTQKKLLSEIELSRQLNVSSFPGMVLKKDNSIWQIPIDYTDTNTMLTFILRLYSTQ